MRRLIPTFVAVAIAVAAVMVSWGATTTDASASARSELSVERLMRDLEGMIPVESPRAYSERTGARASSDLIRAACDFRSVQGIILAAGEVPQLPGHPELEINTLAEWVGVWAISDDVLFPQIGGAAPSEHVGDIACGFGSGHATRGANLDVIASDPCTYLVTESPNSRTAPYSTGQLPGCGAPISTEIARTFLAEDGASGLSTMEVNVGVAPVHGPYRFVVNGNMVIIETVVPTIT